MNHHQLNAPLTINLADVNRDSLALVGGKGANLGELMAAGFPVPGGFCVTTIAFEGFITQTPNADQLYIKLDGLTAEDLAAVQAAGNEVRARLRRTEMPRAVAQSILDIWQDVGHEHAYSVRSSATAEDLPYASFAGQQDTYLNVRGAPALLEAVQNCWVSLFTDRAILYRLQHGFAHRDVRLAVIVQRMVESEVAGIMFTADPVTGNRHVISIDASYGLGEATVSGIVSADLYQVDTHKQAITKRQIADKHLRIQALPQGGVEQVALGGAERTRPTLRDEQVLALARIGQQIETHYHEPQDIEWALSQGQWFILQARPITSLFPLPHPVPDDRTLHVYLSFSHFQVMTDPMPPLVTSLWRMIVPFGAPQGTLENPYLTAAAGRIYLDISLAVRHRLLRRVLPRVLRNADLLAAQALEQMIASGTFAHGPAVRTTSIVRFVAPLLARVLAQVLWKRPEGATERGGLLMDRYVATIEAQLRATPPGSARLVLAVDIMRDAFTHIIKTWFAVPLTGILANAVLIRVARRFANADDVSALGRGVRGNVTTDMDLAVGDLADLIRQSPPLLAHLRQTSIDPSTLVETAAEFEGGAPFKDAWQHFITRYGSRAPAEIDLYRPRWAENPASLLQMVLGSASHGDMRTHRAHYERLILAGDAAAAQVVRAARRSSFGFVRGPLVHRLVRLARELGPTREHHKFWLVRVMALVKPVILEAGQHLVSKGHIACVDDVWFLSVPELLAAMPHPNQSLRSQIAERRAAYTHAWELTPPRIITSDGEIPQFGYTTDAPVDALVGSPVSAGIVEGIARIIRDPQTESLQHGEILIAPFTDPGWTPLFVNASGLVMEVGGLMTHGSVVAREYGIPAVVGVLEATRRIRNGQLVRVNGTAGYIELLHDAPTENQEEILTTSD